jgi:hypothetical protein
MTRKCPITGCGVVFAFYSKIFIPYIYLLSPVMRLQVFYLTTLSVAGFIWLRCRFRWPYDLRRWTVAARLLALRFRIPPGSWKSVSCECSVLSGRGLCVGLITRPEESYSLWRVWVWSWSLGNETLPPPLPPPPQRLSCREEMDFPW